jgi:hypothetical protein
MASSYVNDLRLNEMATGDASGTWGETTNTNLELIAEAFSYGTEAITTNADTHTTTIADGATDPGRALYLKYTGTLDSACTITIGPNTVSKVWIIENGTSGSQDIILSQGSGANITIPAGDTKVVYSDGAGAGAAFVDAFASLSVVDLKVQDDLTVTGDIDVDGTTNLDVVDIDGAVDMASTALVTGVLTTTAATVFNGGFASNAASTISTADNLDTLSLISTDADASVGPNLRMYRNSGSPADNDLVGAIDFEGRNDNSQDVVYSQIFTQILDASDGTEDGYLSFKVMNAGTSRQRLLFDAGETVFNEESEDVDFRVESDNDANALFVQGSDGFVGIGTASPTEKLSVLGGHVSVGDTTGVGGTEFLLEGYREVSGGTKYGNTSIRTTYDISSNASDMLFYTAVSGTNTDERMRIDSGGNVGIGATSMTQPSAGATTLKIQSTDNNKAGAIYLNSANDSVVAYIYPDSTNGLSINTTTSHPMIFRTVGTERMRINSNGSIEISGDGADNEISQFLLNVGNPGNDSYRPMSCHVASTASRSHILFYNPVGQVGYISTSGTSTAYNTSSDYRLKEDDQPMTGATERVKALRPINFAWKVDGSRVDGFLAHEAAEVVPECVTGTKDAMRDEEYEVTAAVLDDDGNVVTEAVMGTRSVPEMQGIDQSKLVPLLTAALQEAITKIEDLTTRLETLENA